MNWGNPFNSILKIQNTRKEVPIQSQLNTISWYTCRPACIGYNWWTNTRPIGPCCWSIAICECILVAWIYGADRFLNDVQLMIGPRSRLWRFFWTWMWKVITPATLFFILFFNWVEYEPLTYGDYVYPRWADVVGWVVGIIPVLVIFGLAIVRILIILYSIEISKWIYWIVSWHFVLYRLFNNRRTNTICGKVFLWFILQ